MSHCYNIFFLLTNNSFYFYGLNDNSLSLRIYCENIVNFFWESFSLWHCFYFYRIYCENIVNFFFERVSIYGVFIFMASPITVCYLEFIMKILWIFCLTDNILSLRIYYENIVIYYYFFFLERVSIYGVVFVFIFMASPITHTHFFNVGLTHYFFFWKY